MEHEIHEECGVFGIFAPEEQNVASTAYYALFALQHSGRNPSGSRAAMSLEGDITTSE